MKTTTVLGAAAVVIVAGFVLITAGKPPINEAIRIGVVTPLTGGVAYWGESSLVGIRLAEQELQAKGITVTVLVEDGQLDPKVALDAAQKLVNIEDVDAMYTEFNPAVIAVSSFLKDKNMVQICNATPVSPLKESENYFKTYLDYEKSCEEVAGVLKERGVKTVGVLKMNLEHGDLCAKGITSVFGESAVIESYNPGETDFRTLLTKLRSSGAEAIFHAAFQPETLASLKNMRELQMDEPFVGLAETMTPGVAEDFADVLEGSIVFGLPQVSPELISRFASVAGDGELVDHNAAALAYLHILQLGEALHECKKETTCVAKKLAEAKENKEIGFQGFQDRIAGFDTYIQEWREGQFEEIK